MSRTPRVAATFVADLLKLFRTDWVTSEDVAQHMGVEIVTARGWCAEFAAQGLVDARKPKRSGRQGAPNVQYRLAQPWGGPAE